MIIFLGIITPSAAIPCTQADTLCTSNSVCRSRRTTYVRSCISLTHRESTDCSEECWTSHKQFLQIASRQGLIDCTCSSSCTAAWIRHVGDICGNIWNSSSTSSQSSSRDSLTPSPIQERQLL
jgi:hypothetical protein